jgi:FkbM family methyltransferase
MPLRPDQLERLRTRFPTLSLHPTCTLLDSHFETNVILHENVTIANSRIGAHTTIDPHTTITGARIGNHVHIGKNTTIETNVTIGNNTTIPPHSHITADINPNAYAPTPDPDNHLPLDRFLLEKLPLHTVYQKWCAINGDQTLRLDYPLTPTDRVIDVGGYLGDFAHDILARHPAHIDIFEPVQSFITHLQKRFPHNPRITIHPFGLAGSTREEKIAIASERSSIHIDTKSTTETIQLVAAQNILEQIEGDIALLKINIEGCEYELLEHLLDQGLIRRIKNLQIQFHNFVENAPARRRQIRSRLSHTHTEQWNYPFIWESWTRT